MNLFQGQNLLEFADRFIKQCRMDHTNQIQAAKTTTEVILKSDLAYAKAWEE